MTDIIDRITESSAGEAAPTPEELTPYVAPLPIPPVLRPGTGDVLRETEIALRPTWVRLHPQLPPTPMWGYDGQVPGPTIEVRRGQRVRIAWTNRIPKGSEYPVTSVQVPLRTDGRPQANTEPGREGVEPDKDVAALPAWTVTHLHGAQTGGGNDGWADTAVGSGDAQLSEYPNDHQAVQWWYHDHAMNVTRWNVHTGLYGTYLVRDDEEDALQLPCGEREIPLLLADRNLDTDEDGRLNGRLLHKTVVVQQQNPETGKPVSTPFTGPYTTVNGRIWPFAEVADGWYRFRLVNASNARIYELVLVDEDGNPVPGVLHQIGSDGGLLPRPVPVGFDAALPTLTVAPAMGVPPRPLGSGGASTCSPTSGAWPARSCAWSTRAATSRRARPTRPVTCATRPSWSSGSAAAVRRTASSCPRCSPAPSGGSRTTSRTATA